MATSPSTRAPATYLGRSPLWDIRARFAVRWQTATLFVVIALSCGIFTWLTIAQHRAYNTHAYDLSWFDQSTWNTARGHWLASSFSHGTYLKEHFSPVLLLLGPVYRFWPTPEALLFIQALFATVAAIPLYFAAGQALKSGSAALMVVLAYLFSPHLHGYILFDFHPDVMALVFIFASFAILEGGKPRAAILALAPAFLVKEDVALVGIGFAVLFWLYGYRRHARRLLAACLVYIVIAEFIVVGVPHLLDLYPSGEHGRYAYLAKGGTSDPELLWAHLTGPLQREAMVYIAGSQGLLPIAGPAALAPAADVLAHVLAEHKPQAQLTLQYPIYPLALLTIASIFNIRVIASMELTGNILTRIGVRTPIAPFAETKGATGVAVALAGVLLLSELVSWFVGSPLGPMRFTPERFQTNAHTAAIERISATVPRDVSLSAQSSILPHLSEREHIREFPFIDYAAYVLVDRKGFRAWQSDVAGYDRVLASLPGRGYCLLRADDGVELWALEDFCTLH